MEVQIQLIVGNKEKRRVGVGDEVELEAKLTWAATK